ncbi:MAG: acyl-CoA/acyl-ACP dehydrogenase [Thermoleophilia bacterium]|nr:acyl-CoA/acyl-ACP dehydrogenase [Thermoleophilia bacterium]
MPNVDSFSLPREWVPDEAWDLVEAVRGWADREVIPVRQRIDEDWEAHEIVKPLLKSLCCDLGYQQACWPEQYGGLGIDGITSCLLLEEMSRADSGLATAASCSIWAMSAVFPPEDNPHVMEHFTPKFLDKERWYVGCVALTEPHSGSDIENVDGTHGRYIRTRATLDGDEWVVNGHKLWPTNSGGVGDVFCTLCTTDPNAGDDGVAIVYVPADTPGVTQSKPYRKAGMNGDANGDIWFENARVPFEFRAHGPGKDAARARAMVTSGNVGTAAQCIGVMKNLYELVKDWCDTRIVAGKPLKEHSITAAVLADIVTSIEVSRAETYTKARMLDRPDIYGRKDTPEMLARTRVTKLFVSDQLTKVVNQVLDLMGSYGYARESDVEKHWRDSKIMSLWMGGRALPQLDIARWFFDAKEY